MKTFIFCAVTDTLKRLRIIIFIFGNLKDCLMKILQFLLQVIIASIHNQVILVIKQECNLVEVG